jgi:amidase
MTVANLVHLSASELIRHLASGTIAPSEVIGQLKAHIDITNPVINAFDSTKLETKISAAGVLHGLPITVKDQIAVAGHPRNYGLNKAFPDTCRSTASAVQRLVDEGAIVVGKTSMPPYAIDFQTSNARIGTTNNPWNIAYTAGGSSGGGAAAVATGMSYLDIGADLSGSLRIPAAFCGVTSLLPSQGALATDGLLLTESQLDHFVRIGPIARTVEDLMLAWGIMSGTQHSAPSAQVTRLAVWRGDGTTLVDPEIGHAFDATAELLAGNGANIVRTSFSSLLSHEVRHAFGEIMGYETGALLPTAARLLMRTFGAASARRSPAFLAAVHKGYKRDRKAYAAVLEVRQRIQERNDKDTHQFDALLLPVCSLQPFRHRTPDSERNGIRDYVAHFEVGGKSIGYWDALTAFATPVSLIGNPVVTIPIGLDSNGLPVGAQLVGKRGCEWRLLQIAATVSQRLPRISFLAAASHNPTLKESYAI